MDQPSSSKDLVEVDSSNATLTEDENERERRRQERREKRAQRDALLNPDEVAEKERKRREKKEKKKAEKMMNKSQEEIIEVEKETIVKRDSDLQEVVVQEPPLPNVAQVAIDMPDVDVSAPVVRPLSAERALASDKPSTPTVIQVAETEPTEKEIQERIEKKKALKEKIKQKSETPEATEEVTFPRSIEERLAEKHALREKLQKKNDQSTEEPTESTETPETTNSVSPEATDSIPSEPRNLVTPETTEDVTQPIEEVSSPIEDRLAKKRALKEKLQKKNDQLTDESNETPTEVTSPRSIEERLAEKRALRENNPPTIEESPVPPEDTPVGDETDSPASPARSTQEIEARLAKKKALKERVKKKRVSINEDKNTVAMIPNLTPEPEAGSPTKPKDLQSRLALMREKRKQKAEENKLKEEQEDVDGEPPIEREDSLDSLPDELPWQLYKELAEEEYEPEESDDEDLSESDDEKYNAPTNEDLPDLYGVMDELDAEDIQLTLKSPPIESVFPPEEDAKLQQHRDQVDDLKRDVEEHMIEAYLEEFEQKVEEEILMIGNVSLEDVQLEESRLREEHVTFQQQQAKVQRQRQQEILQAMERAKKYVMERYKEKSREIRMREEHLMQKDRNYKDEIHRAFRKSESQLRKALRKRKAEIKTMYGDLTYADGQYGGSKGRRWKVDWDRAPQPIQVRLKCLRGVKDKLPRSRYVLMVSLYSRLGGNVMKWSNLKGQQWGGATLPIDHNGDFFNFEMMIDQSVFTVCPSCPDMRPGMLLVFELFILRGPVTPTDKVVGWGCFPVCDSNFQVIEGRYKTPMLRGEMDPAIDKFEVIEKLMADDLENWLCNFYFEIVKLPRYMAGQKEYEVELQFTSSLLGAPTRTEQDDNIDGERPVYGSSVDTKSRTSLQSDVSSAVKQKFFDDDDGDEKTSYLGSQLQLKRAEDLSTELRHRKKNSVVSLNKEDENNNEDEIQLLKSHSREDFEPVKGHPGMFYKLHRNTAADDYVQQTYTMVPKTPVLMQQYTPKARKLTHTEELERHSHTVKLPFSNKGRIDHRTTRKFQYIGRMVLTELGISQVKSREFWSMVFMLIVCYFMRMYIHYLGQWASLLGFRVPLNKFEFLPYTVNLNYQNTLLRTREEIALIVIGPFTNLVFFIVFVLISAFIQLLFERFPNLLSRFIMAFGIHCVLDPFWILITDSILERYADRGGDFPIGDAFKLYWHFDRFYNNANVTLFIATALTAFLYFVTAFCAITVLYIYFLRVHNNGRLIDVYWRLHGKEDAFFMPFDLEMSNEELNYICRKAEQWRGEEGERRKTAVYDYLLQQEKLQEVSQGERKSLNKETTTHVSIHTLHLDGLRELYRHFLKLPDGAIVEVFGEMNVPGIDDSMKQALIKRTNFQSLETKKSIEEPEHFVENTLQLPGKSSDISNV